jgi:hypothetical protein
MLGGNVEVGYIMDLALLNYGPSVLSEEEIIVRRSVHNVVLLAT